MSVEAVMAAWLSVYMMAELTFVSFMMSFVVRSVPQVSPL